MTKRGLPHPEHLRLGQILTGVWVQLLHELGGLLNAYPRTGPRAFPAKQLKVAIEALDAARRELESAVYEEHPAVADTSDYSPCEEHLAAIVVPEKPHPEPRNSTMTKPGLPHPEHLRLGQVLSGVRAQLRREQTALVNAYPKTGPRAFPAKQLEVAIEALDAARRELENVVYEEHPAVAATEDYFPYEEHRAEVVVPEKPGSSTARVSAFWRGSPRG
ncbi:hypothetical protein ABT124_40050 [Streptomyces sp. NPDC001982]|uniref:hypothetical protein n=1 Tax=Streptomyces sp. NPDC001982 TaxID=3154405 RepID=UPI003331B4E0